jgi:HEAT repeat protein
MLQQHNQAPKERRSDWLLALGNTGSPQALSVILSQSNSQEDRMRWVVASALNPVNHPKAEETLLRYAESDPVKDVRLNAISAFEYRSWSSQVYRRLVSCLKRERDPEVRVALLRVLWTQRGRYPDVVSLVRRYAQSDPSPEVRRQAKEMLQSGGL